MRDAEGHADDCVNLQRGWVGEAGERVWGREAGNEQRQCGRRELVLARAYRQRLTMNGKDNREGRGIAQSCRHRPPQRTASLAVGWRELGAALLTAN